MKKWIVILLLLSYQSCSQEKQINLITNQYMIGLFDSLNTIQWDKWYDVKIEININFEENKAFFTNKAYTTLNITKFIGKDEINDNSENKTIISKYDAIDQDSTYLYLQYRKWINSKDYQVYLIYDDFIIVYYTDH